MGTAAAVLPSEVRRVMTGTPYWQKVKHARYLLAQKFNKDWNPNYKVSDTEPWIYITAVKNNEEVYLQGVQNVAIQTFEASVENAARRISEGTHRLATDDEVVKFKADRAGRERLCIEEEARVNPTRAAQLASIHSSEALTKATEAIAANTLATREALQSSMSTETGTDGESKTKVQRR